MNPITLQNGNVCGHNCQNIDTWIAKAFLTAFWLTERDKEWELCRNPGKCSSAQVTWLRAEERLQRCVGDPVLCLSFCRSSLYVPIKWPLLRVLVARSECFLLASCLHWDVLFANTSYTFLSRIATPSDIHIDTLPPTPCHGKVWLPRDCGDTQ